MSAALYGSVVSNIDREDLRRISIPLIEDLILVSIPLIEDLIVV
jgi:hypothetical protein